MTDARTLATLEDIVRRESRSILQYVSESYPWATAEEQAAVAQLQKLIAEERECIAALGRFLVSRRHVFPYVGSYPSDFTTINFVSLDYLVPVLADYERQAIAALERDLSGIADADARAIVQAILDSKRRHLQTLEKMAADRAPARPAPAVPAGTP